MNLHENRFSTFEEILDTVGVLCHTNVGRSMRPLLREGKDVMVICKPTAYPLKKCEAVLFRRPGVTGRGAYVLHRILEIHADGTYWIVGDNCTVGENVAESDILGVLTEINRGGRTVKVTDFGYRLYVNLWCRPYRWRFFVLKTVRFVGRAGKRFIRIFQKH